MARDHHIVNYCTPTKIRSDCVWTFGSTQKYPRSTKSEQLVLEMEKVFFPKREENNNFVFAAIGLANPDTGKYIHIFNWKFPSHQ